MKRGITLLAVGLALTLSGCATTAKKSPFVKPGKLMGEMIDERVQQIPYQHKSELLQNMLWLAQAGEQAVPSLLAAMDHQDPKVRSSIAWIFGRMGDRRVIPMLQQRKNEPNEVTRLEIARTLLTLGDYSMVPELIHGLDSDLPHVRYLCYDALHRTTKHSFDYDHRASDPMDRQASIAKWKDWWKNQSKEIWFNGKNGLAAPQGR